jgi:hypothetical protein
MPHRHAALGTGHVRFKFEGLRAASARVEQVVIVVRDPARAAEAEGLIANRE